MNYVQQYLPTTKKSEDKNNQFQFTIHQVSWSTFMVMLELLLKLKQVICTLNLQPGPAVFPMNLRKKNEL